MILRKFLSAAIAVLMLLPLCSCQNDGEPYIRYFAAMDTYISIKIDRDGKFGDSELEGFALECEKICRDIEDKISKTSENGIVAEFNGSGSDALITDQTVLDLLKVSLDLYSESEGAFDPTLGKVSELWNIKGGGPVPSEDSIADALSHTGAYKLNFRDEGVSKSDPELMLDFGAIGKGYACEKIVAYLRQCGVTSGLVTVGGNVGVIGSKNSSRPYVIGISDPENTKDVKGFISIDGGYVSVSGNYERFFWENGVRYHHIIDPSSGYPTDNGISAIAVVCEKGAASDALSTALFVMGYEKAMEFYADSDIDFEALFIRENGEVLFTDGLKDRYEPNA